MTSATCPICRQLVAADARGIAPHMRRGAPCAGGGAVRQEAQKLRRVKSQAEKLAALNKRKKLQRIRDRKARIALAADRRATLIAALPATVHAIAAVMGLTPEGARRAIIRAGAVIVGSVPAEGGNGGKRRVVWGMP